MLNHIFSCVHTPVVWDDLLVVRAVEDEKTILKSDLTTDVKLFCTRILHATHLELSMLTNCEKCPSWHLQFWHYLLQDLYRDRVIPSTTVFGGRRQYTNELRHQHLDRYSSVAWHIDYVSAKESQTY